MIKRQTTHHTFHTDKQYNVIAYLRRSTSNKQELSLDRQEDSARETIVGNGFIPEDVNYFIESKSAYNGVKIVDGKPIRRRTEFTRMLAEIDRSKDPVILLTYEDSRLSRNDIDSQEILDRLFGEYDLKKKKIERIVFHGGETWTDLSNKGDIKQRLLDRYKESLKTGDRSKKASLRELRKGRYIYSTPRGINRLKKGEDELTLNDDIKYIVKAWEMRASGKSKIVINDYLHANGIILNVSFEEFFQTLIYAGLWLDPENGDLVPQKFKGGGAPISFELFQKVQGTLIKNTGIKAVSKYGDKQKDDPIANLLKWEFDNKKGFSVEFPKGQYRSYKSNAYGGFNRSEMKIIKDFISQTSLIFKEIITKVQIFFIIKRGVIDPDFNSRLQALIDRYQEGIKTDLEGGFMKGLSEIVADDKYVDYIFEQLRIRNPDFVNDFADMIRVYFEEIAKKQKLFDPDERRKLIRSLEDQISKKEESKTNILKDALIKGYSADIANSVVLDVEREISSLRKQILSLYHASEIELFIQRIPSILGKIFELSSKVLGVKEIESVKSDLLKLIELTTFELSVSTKKELTVKLFEGLEDVLKVDSSIWLPE